MPPDEIDLVLKEKRHDYGDVYTFIFTPATPVVYEAGQYAHFRIRSLEHPDRPVRELSFASAPSDSEIMLSVNTRSQSAFQKAFLELSPGDTIGLFKIYGHIKTPAVGEKAVLIAQGVGMTPMRSIFRDLAHAGREADATLVQVDRGHYLYQDEFADRPFPQYRITREEVVATLTQVVSVNADAVFLIAGAPTFVLDIESALTKLGVASGRIHRDVFNGLEE